MLQNNITAAIKNKVSLLEVISQRIRVKKQGNNYLALCPFHNEKTPSFHINDQEGFYHCFGCGKNGDLFSFIMEYENYSFKDALQYFADLAGIALPTYTKSPPALPSVNPKGTDLYRLLSVVTDWLHQQLFTQDHTLALKYLLGRGLSQYTIKTFKLGYVPRDISPLLELVSSQGFTVADMLHLGLISGNPNAYKNTFHNRVIFPIKNKTGKVIAIGGRGCHNELPKYLNSKESSLFYKRLTLYGLHEALKGFKSNQHIILVEGYLDVIMLQQQGFAAVSSLGTAVSDEQLQLLVKLKIPLYVCFDGDNAGNRAALKIAQMLLANIDEYTLPKFIHLPQGEDPDSYLRKYPKEDFQVLINTAQPLSEFLWQQTVKDITIDSPETKVLIAKQLMTYSNSIINPLLKEEFIKYFTHKLNSVFNQVTQVGYKNNLLGYNLNDNKIGYLNKNKYNKFTKLHSTNHSVTLDKNAVKRANQNNMLTREYMILAYIISCPEIYGTIEQEFSVLKFSTKVLEEFKQTIVAILDNMPEVNATILQQEVAKKGFDTILYEIMHMHIIKKALNRMQEPKEFVDAFYDIYKRLLFNSLNQDIINIKGNVSHLRDIDIVGNKLAEQTQILSEEIKQTKFFNGNNDGKR